jgi:hypothetical protein
VETRGKATQKRRPSPSEVAQRRALESEIYPALAKLKGEVSQSDRRSRKSAFKISPPKRFAVLRRNEEILNPLTPVCSARWKR